MSQYKITDKLPIAVRGELGFNATLSAKDVTALMAHRLVEAFNTQETSANEFRAALAKLAFDGVSVPTYSTVLRSDTEFVVVLYYTTALTKVGDKVIHLPKLIATVYRPMCYGLSLYMPTTQEEKQQFRGSLTMTISQGMLLVTKRSGWLGSNELIDWLRRTYDAAVDV